MILQIFYKCINDLDLSDVYPYLSVERQASVDKMKFEKDKKLSAGAGLLMDEAFKEAGIKEEHPAIKKGPNGKPYLRDYEGVFFNLSHSGDYVFLALSDMEVGCDVEEIEPPEKFTSSRLPIARRFFNEKETAEILSRKDIVTQNELFFKIWTMKESFIKAKGGGLSIPLDSFNVLTGEGTEGAVFKNHDLALGYVFTTCILKNGQN